MVRVAPKLLTRIYDLHTKFLPKFHQALREITRNINFVEKEMQAEDGSEDPVYAQPPGAPTLLERRPQNRVPPAKRWAERRAGEEAE